MTRLTHRHSTLGANMTSTPKRLAHWPSPINPLVPRTARPRGSGLLAAITCLALALGCSTEKQEPITSSQTHWLQKCEKTSECGDLECQCGVCTLPCTSDDACSSLGDDATCTETSGIDACESGSSGEICLQACDDGSCGSDSECVDGACVPKTSSGTTPGVDCDDYPSCSIDEPCDGNTNCIAFFACGGAICIDAEDACELSCPDPDECSIDESYPEQIHCPGKVPAHPRSGNTPDPSPDAGATTDDPGPADPKPSTDPLMCADYESCDADNPTCSDGSGCVAVGCGGGSCIDFEDACKLLCSSGSCISLDSFPPQVGCDGGSRIPVVQAPDEPDPQPVPEPTDAGVSNPPAPDAGTSSEPPGIACGDYPECDALDNMCPAGSDCVRIDGCNAPLCIATDEACALSCPDATECEILESFPLQIGCPGKVPGIPDSTPTIDLADLNRDCVDDMCPSGLTPVKFFGIAGASGPEFCSCSIPCVDTAEVCPEGSTCQTIADGPGTVCVRDEPSGEVCGNTVCAEGQRCCDKCSSQCIAALSGANCPDDNDPDRVCAGFACGPDQTCAAGTQYCDQFTGGVAPSPTTYTCRDFPPECSNDPTCSCLGITPGGGGAQTCDADTDGNVTVQAFAP